MWCFQCGASYEAGVVACVECGVGLVDQPPLAPEDVGDLDDEQIAYEFHDWSFEARRMLDQLLTGRHIPHAWQGAAMIVRASRSSRARSVPSRTTTANSSPPSRPIISSSVISPLSRSETRLSSRSPIG